jgi:hypothetical protein
VLAVAAQGGDPTTATVAAIGETRSLLWTRTGGVNPDVELLPGTGGVTPDMMLADIEAEAELDAKRVPAQQASARALTDAVAVERTRRNDPAAGVAGNSYTSPTYGYTVTWDSTWSGVEANTMDGYDALSLDSGGANVSFWAQASADGVPGPCLDQRIGAMRKLEGIRDFAPKTGADGRPIAGNDGQRAYGVFTSTLVSEDGTSGPYVQHLECRVLVRHEAVLMITMLTVPELYEAQAQALERLLAGLQVPTGAGIPQAATGTPTADGTSAAEGARATPDAPDATPVADRPSGSV